MKYQVEIENRTVEIEFEQSNDNIKAIIDGTSYEATLCAPETGVYTLLMNDKVYELTVAPTTDNLIVTVAGERFNARVIDHKQSRGKQDAATSGTETIRAPMPGRVVQLIKSVGDSVKAGEAVVVIEAMKMQNELSASKTGSVVEVKVSSGQTVGAGDVLVVIE